MPRGSQTYHRVTVIKQRGLVEYHRLQLSAAADDDDTALRHWSLEFGSEIL